jgi:hypothetical protein
MIAIIIKLEIPAIAIIPSTARIHKIKATEAISPKGLGRIPISQIINKNIIMSQRVITCPSKLNRGKGSKETAPYLNIQTIKRITSIKINIALYSNYPKE